MTRRSLTCRECGRLNNNPIYDPVCDTDRYNCVCGVVHVVDAVSWSLLEPAKPPTQFRDCVVACACFRIKHKQEVTLYSVYDTDSNLALETRCLIKAVDALDEVMDKGGMGYFRQKTE